MANVIGVRFKRSSSVSYVRTDQEVHLGDKVLVQTERGIVYGVISMEEVPMADDSISDSLPSLLRLADAEDEETNETNERMAKDAWAICAEKIRQHGLDMKLVDAEYTFDRSKLIFCFTAEDRVDFRSLVRDLAQTFRTRIELRQIGVRDQAKMIGGLGPCGQAVCCRRYMQDFLPVSIRMAKTQGLSLNPTKISGVCGRLMCCLNYEQDNYLENTKKVPAKGTLVLTQEGQGYVVDRDVLLQRVRVHIYKNDNSEEERYFPVEDIEVLRKRKKGQPRPALWEEDRLQDHDFVTEGEKKARAEAEAGDPGVCAQCACPMHAAMAAAQAESQTQAQTESQAQAQAQTESQVRAESQAQAESQVRAQTEDPAALSAQDMTQDQAQAQEKTQQAQAQVPDKRPLEKPETAYGRKGRARPRNRRRGRR